MSDPNDCPESDRPFDGDRRRDPREGAGEDAAEDADNPADGRRHDRRTDSRAGRSPSTGSDGGAPRTTGAAPRTNGDAGGRGGPPRGPRGHPEPVAPGQAGDAPRGRGELERELLRLENGAGDVERPYLTGLPEAFAGEELLFEWLGGLQETAGLKRASEALEYYAEVGWLSDDAAEALREYLLGLDLDASDPRELDADDHLESLAYVARLARLTERESTA